MLPPVRAVSNTSIVSQRQTAVVADSLVDVSTVADAGAMLSSAVNASVEGKLNILIAAARERMVDSLFAVIDAVSKALDMPQEPGESNVGYALRLADTIRDLTPKQLTAVQQQLRAQGQALPLQLIAQALHDPAAPAAAQVVAYLEVVRYKDRDLATSAVVRSYGQNSGNSQAGASASAGSRQNAAAGTPENVRSEGHGNATPANPVESRAPSAAAIAASTQVAPGDRPVSSPMTAAPPLSADELSPETFEEVEEVLPEATTAAEAIDTDAPAETVPQPRANVVQLASEIPRELRQLSAEVQEGLKVVLQAAMDVAGPEIASIIADSEQLAESVVAQALVADVLDSQELGVPNAPVPTDVADPAVPVPAEADVAVAPLSDDVAAEALAVQSLPEAPGDEAILSSAMQLAAARMPEILPLAQAVPFAIAQYLPAADRIAGDEDLVDRIDPVDDEEHERDQEGGERKDGEHAAADDEEAATDEQQKAGPGDGVPEALTAAQANESGTAPVAALAAPSLALPMAAQSVAVNRGAYDFYQRMAGWE